MTFKLPNQQKHSRQRGVVNIITVASIGLFSLGIAIVVAQNSLEGLAKNRNIVSGDEIFDTADAALREGTYQFLGETTHAYAGGTPLLLNDATNGEITVQQPQWPYVLVGGSAANAKTHRTAVHTITLYPEGLAFEHAVYAQYLLTLGGSMEVNGSIFANDGIAFNGNNAIVNGNAYTPDGDFSDPDNVNGDVFTGVQPIPPPQLDVQPYKDAAVAGGTLFTAAVDAETHLNGNTRGTVGNPAVIYVATTEKTKIQGVSTNLTGSLVTEGSLDVTGGTYTAVAPYAAIVVLGDLKIAGGATINGVVYVTGTTSFGGGNNTINGSLISAGGASVTDLTGNATINYDPDLATNWQDLLGLVTTSASPPRIILWNEE